MHEARAQRHRSPSPTLHQEVKDLMQELETRLAWIEYHGTKDECARAIEELETVTSAYHYHQSALAHQLEKEVFRDHEERGVNIDDLTRGAASTVAMARSQDPSTYRGKLVSYRILFEDTPNLAQCYSRGEYTEAQIEAILSPLKKIDAEYRTAFDDFLRQNPDMFESQGTRQIRDTVTKFTLQYLEDDQCHEAEDAAQKRHIRFHRDGDLIRFSGCLPVIQGVALREHLRHTSFTIKQHGDPRTRAQIEADLLVANLVSGSRKKLPLALSLNLIMTDRSLFLGDKEPAFLEGYGYISSQIIREMIAGPPIDGEVSYRNSTQENYLEQLDTVTEIVRLYTAPGDSELVAMDSKARLFPEKLRAFLRVRDRYCRTPFCNGLVEEADHIIQHHLGGETSAGNGDGKCSLCNKAKELPGWDEYMALDNPHSIIINNMGMRYLSKSPPATGLVHQPFPQLMCDSKWIQGFRRRLAQHPGE